MSEGMIPTCASCALHRPTDPQSCEAFPEGIPDRILYGGFDHRTPFPGDGGVLWTLDPNLAEWIERYERQPFPPSQPRTGR